MWQSNIKTSLDYNNEIATAATLHKMLTHYSLRSAYRYAYYRLRDE